MTTAEIAELVEQLEEIYEDLEARVSEAKYLVRKLPDNLRDRARQYWLATLEIALNDGHDWVGGCPETMHDTIRALKNDLDLDESEGE